MRWKFHSLCILFLILATSSSAYADMVGQDISQTPAFNQYVKNANSMNQELSALGQRIAAEKKQLANVPDNRLIELGVNILPFIKVGCAGMVLCLASMALYILYLVKYNPRKWRLSTSRNTLRQFRNKVLRQNGLLALLLGFAFLCAPAPVDAGTNVLTDISMYYSGKAEEKGYLLCKYHKGPIDLGYEAIGGIPVLQKPDPGFEREYDLLAHQLGLGLPTSAEEYAALYDHAQNDAQRRVAALLLARSDKDMAQQAASLIIDRITGQGGRRVEPVIADARQIMAAFSDSDNRLLVGPLVRLFLEKMMGRIRDIQGLDALVDMAMAYDAFEVMREPTAKVLKNTPTRLSFDDAVLTAGILFRIDKDAARALFNGIRGDWRGLARSAAVRPKLVGLIRDLSGVAAFAPLYDNETLYRGLQQQPNEMRVQITSLFDQADPPLARVAYGSIGREPGDLVFQDSQSLGLLADLTVKYDKEAAPALAKTLMHTVAARPVPYSAAVLLDAAQTLGQDPQAFTEGVLTAIAEVNASGSLNNDLIVALVERLPAPRLAGFAGYFAKKPALAKRVLPIYQDKDKGAFQALLRQAFANDPGEIGSLRLRNDVLDVSPVAAAFSAKAVADVTSLPAALLFAQNELSGPNPDVKLVRRALIPQCDALFRHFLSEEKKALHQEQVLNALILRAIVLESGGAAFKTEAEVLSRMVNDYFSGAIGNGTAALAGQIEAQREELAALKDHVAARDAVVRAAWLTAIFCIVVALYLVFGWLLSMAYACNRLLPDNNFSLINWWLHCLESFASYLMATLLFFPLGIMDKLMAQFLRGLLSRETVTPDVAQCLAMLDADLCPKAPLAAQEEADA